jgi:hypothetical protein
MLNTVIRTLIGYSDVRDKLALLQIFNPIADRLSCQVIRTPTLAIHTGGASPLAMTTVASHLLVNGVLLTIALNVDMPALSGGNIVSPNTVNVYCYFVDSAGTVTAASGTPATTLAGVVFPPFPVNKTLLGFLIVTMAAAATFTAGTTNLDAANTTVVYCSPTGAFDPSVKLA